MGSAAARHLALRGKSVALIGPGEPRSKATNQGVFASHYDQARITRQLDSDQVWSLLSCQSISRYADIENRAGRDFFYDVGSVMAGPRSGPGSDFVAKARRVGATLGIEHDVLEGAQLAARFPFFRFPPGTQALHEAKGAGYINPRLHVAAEIACAQTDHCIVVPYEVTHIAESSMGITVHCSNQKRYSAEKVVVACGAYSGRSGLLPDPLPMKFFARTIAFFKLGEAEAARLRNMPSLVYVPPDLSCDPYVLPPVMYPDGKVYLKIGGDPEDVELSGDREIGDWFRSHGDANVGAFLAEQLLKIMPDLDFEQITYGSCVTSYTKSGKPLIYGQTDRIFALTGGNGAGAKCADELGRIAAILMIEGKVPKGLYEASFGP